MFSVDFLLTTAICGIAQYLADQNVLNIEYYNRENLATVTKFSLY